jgi:hypothetical protein
MFPARCALRERRVARLRPANAGKWFGKKKGDRQMEALILIIVLGTSIWVAVDASTIGVKKGQLKGIADMGPAGWFFVCLLLWIVGFPFYLAKRSELKRVNTPGNLTPSQPAAAPSQISPVICPLCKKSQTVLLNTGRRYCSQCNKMLS